jgi:hypothetical protein
MLTIATSIIMHHQLFSWFNTICAGLMALILFAVGLRGIFTRKPFLLHSSIPSVFFLLLMLTNIIAPFDSYRAGAMGPEPLGVFLVSGVLLGTIMSLVQWRGYRMRGYQAFGIRAQVFRDCLHKALRRLNLPFHDRVLSIHLETLDTDLQVSTQDWFGMAQLRIKPLGHRATLTTIAKGLEDEFSTSMVKASMSVFISCIVFGILMVALMYQCARLHM